MRKIVGVAILLILLFLSYRVGRSGNQRDVVHAAEAPNSKWTKVETPLVLSHDERLGVALTQGFWQSTSLSKDKQLVSPLAVKIECRADDKACRESQATVFLGVLKADLLEYDIVSWAADGIVADDADEGPCGIGHRLSLDFKSSSVTVTDYPKKVSADKSCKGFQDADSYSLHGGELVLYPPAPWDPLALPEGK